MDTSTQHSILLVDDDIAHRTMLKVNLSSEGYSLHEVSDGDEVIPFLQNQQAELILLDLKMTRMDGLDTLAALNQAGYGIPVIVITAFSSVESAVEAMKLGAVDYLTKPIDIDELKLKISRAFGNLKMQRENLELKQRIGEKFDFANIIGSSEPMQQLFSTLSLVAPTDATVLITGESGTGKELIANALHEHSRRKDAPFIKLNCASLNENLLESELFGHESGAFTGAVARRQGRFELADQGTLFLDEIGDMSLPTQAKILRVLQEGEFERLGGSETLSVDVRLLAATHKDLEAMIEKGAFRQDLYYRLSVVPLHLPSLRERNTDILELTNYFLKRYTKKNRKDIKGIRPDALKLLMDYTWPGNIRELENTIERAVILCLGEQVTVEELPAHLRPELPPASRTAAVEQGFTLRDMERELIRSTLAETGNNKSKTAKKLGIARQTLLNKIKEYGL